MSPHAIILVINSGSSSIKFKLYKMPTAEVLAKGNIQRIGDDEAEIDLAAGGEKLEIKQSVADHQAGLELIGRLLQETAAVPLKSLSEISACGHRVVHGGEDVSGSVLVTKDIEECIARNAELAPLHNPPNLDGIRATRRLLGGIPQIACFDTAFHSTMPAKAWRYALPDEVYRKFKVRRYGFHGTSHRYVCGRAAEMLAKDSLDLISCHLGNGCSVTAVQKGRSIDTSMGMTPLEGLVMGTRSGDIDPAIILFLAERGYDPDQLDELLNEASGLLGISGISNDVRDLEDHASEGNKKAELALEIFAYRVRKYIGSYLSVLNGCDAIIMTGGIGEHGKRMRERILSGLDNLGILLDMDKNNSTTGKAGAIHSVKSKIQLLVIPTDEEAAIAFDTYELICGS